MTIDEWAEHILSGVTGEYRAISRNNPRLVQLVKDYVRLIQTEAVSAGLFLEDDPSNGNWWEESDLLQLVDTLKKRISFILNEEGLLQEVSAIREENATRRRTSRSCYHTLRQLTKLNLPDDVGEVVDICLAKLKKLMDDE